MKRIQCILLALFTLCLHSCQPLEHPKPQADQANPFLGCTHTIERIYATPSGDWGMNIQYGYNKAGRLAAMSTDYFTFNGFDAKLDDFRATSCKRMFRVTAEGEFVLLDEVMLDAKSKQPVKRSFYEPKVTHWMSLEEAQREREPEREKEKPTF